MPQPVVGCDPSRAFIDTGNLPSGMADRIASRYDRHTIHFNSFVHLAAAMI